MPFEGETTGWLTPTDLELGARLNARDERHSNVPATTMATSHPYRTRQRGAKSLRSAVSLDLNA